MCRKSLAVLLSLCLLSPCLSAQDSRQEAASNAAIVIASMRTDLNLLYASIQSYRNQISELRYLISQSQTDLIEQQKLLTISENNLKATEAQYNALVLDYQRLNRSYQRSLKTGKIKTIAIVALSAIAIGVTTAAVLK